MKEKGRRFMDEVEEQTTVTEAVPEEEETDRSAERDERLSEKNAKKLDKLMKKKKKREEKSNREVLSYEDMPLEEREDEQSKKTVKLNRKRVVIAAVIVVLAFVLVFLFANSDRLSMHNITNFVSYGILNRDSEERFPVSVRGENIEAGNFSRMGQDLYYVSDTKLEGLNNYGKSVFSAQHSYNSPSLVTAKDYSLVYSLGGTGYRISDAEATIFSGEAENNILAGDILDNGTYALVTQSDGYLSKLYVYNKDNKQIYAYSFADYYITSMSLCPNGKYAVLSGLSAHNGSEISSLYVLDFTMDTPAQFKEFEENIIYEVGYLNDVSACAIGNNASCVINTRSGDVQTYDNAGRTLTAYDINTDTDNFAVSLSRSGDGRNCDIVSFNTNGTVKNEFSTDLRVIDISTYKNRVALLTTDKIYLYNKDGGLVADSGEVVDPRAVVLYTSSDAYVLDTSEIRSVSM